MNKNKTKQTTTNNNIDNNINDDTTNHSNDDIIRAGRAPGRRARGSAAASCPLS